MKSIAPNYLRETVRLYPVIYDSDIVITHMPEQNHAGRDLESFRRQTRRGVRLSKRLHNMYARELFLAGSGEDFKKAEAFFRESAADAGRDADEVMESCLVAARAARLSGDTVGFFKYAGKVIAGEGCSEICCELGHFYEEAADYTEAAIWYYNAVYETTPILKKEAGDREGLEGLIRCYTEMKLPREVHLYEEELGRL